MATRNHHDPMLRTLLEAPDDAAHEAALAVLAERARTVAERVAARVRGNAFGAEDADDVVANVLFRITRQLRERPDAIQTFDGFVATLTHNAINDLFRARFPERTRLKNRIRYVMTHDVRLATWTADAGIAAGLAAWRGSERLLDRLTLPRERATLRMLRSDAPADALVEILTFLDKPVLLDDLVTLAADLWGIADQEPVALTTNIDAEDSVAQRLEQRQQVEWMWREIGALPVRQRMALLLNLRDSDGLNALALFLMLGVATLNQIAQTLEMTSQRLSELWPELPVGDLRIAELLGATRQQVINLRKAARERLARRAGE